MFQRKDLSKNEVVLSVDGPLNAEATSEFHRQVEDLVAASYATIILDLSRTESINSSALGKILLFRKKLAEDRRVIRIKGCSEALYKTFMMIKFDALIPIEK
ncbi:MAG TPA: STAS domain-containing protein [Spirochaetia bacterium]|nr:STAS domain-containing protein [Spirochaetia bacterium]HTZ50793.1 STAS domain-containing protein [Spirochaetia bacterium]